MRFNIISILLCSLLPLLITGCGLGRWGSAGLPEQTASAQGIESLEDAARFTVIMADNFFGYADSNMISPPVWTLPEYKQAIYTFENQGVLEHNWVVVKPGVTIPIPFNEIQANDLLLYDLGKVPGNGVTHVTFTTPAPGTYQIICTISGHYPFMQGRLVVAQSKQ